MTQHTPECLASAQRIAQEIQDYQARWPDYCRKCRGWGITSWQENQAPYGSGHYWPETFTEPCDCTMHNKCPRCGHQHNYDWIGDTEADQKPCEICGWNWGKNPDDVCPEPHECYCWRYEEMEW